MKEEEEEAEQKKHTQTLQVLTRKGYELQMLITYSCVKLLKFRCKQSSKNNSGHMPYFFF